MVAAGVLRGPPHELTRARAPRRLARSPHVGETVVTAGSGPSRRCGMVRAGDHQAFMDDLARMRESAVARKPSPALSSAGLDRARRLPLALDRERSRRVDSPRAPPPARGGRVASVPRPGERSSRDVTGGAQACSAMAALSDHRLTRLSGPGTLRGALAHQGGRTDVPTRSGSCLLLSGALRSRPHQPRMRRLQRSLRTSPSQKKGRRSARSPRRLRCARPARSSTSSSAAAAPSTAATLGYDANTIRKTVHVRGWQRHLHDPVPSADHACHATRVA